MAAGRAIGNRVAPIRFLISCAVFVAGLAIYWWSGGDRWQDGAALAFDAAAAIFLASLIPLVGYATHADMRQHSAENDAGRTLILIVTTILTIVVMAAVSGELPGARAGIPLAIVKLIGTLLLIWLFANSVYGLHYAHAWYTQAEGHDAEGLAFPGTDCPLYLDFAYFAFTLGMTFQTSDVNVTARPLRRVVLLHCFGAFIFNIGVIAFAINGLAGGTS
jgi:uncharacterized membrane protein